MNINSSYTNTSYKGGYTFNSSTAIIPFSPKQVLEKLLKDPLYIKQYLTQAMNADAKGDALVSVYGDDGQKRAVFGNSITNTSDIQPASVGTFSSLAKALENVNMIVKSIELGKAEYIKAIYAQDGVNLSDAKANEIYNQLVKVQDLLKETLVQYQGINNARNKAYDSMKTSYAATQKTVDSLGQNKTQA